MKLNISVVSLFTILIASEQALGISDKAKKLALQKDDFDMDDNFFDSENEIEDSDDDFGFGDSDFFDDDDDDFFVSSVSLEEDLPECSNLTEVEVAEGVKCKVVEIRLRDRLFERLIEQSWSDLQIKMNEEAAIKGIVIDPFHVDPVLKEPIDVKQQGINIKAKDIYVYGLSSISLDKAIVTRNENLTDFHADIGFAFTALEVNGTYSAKGKAGFVDVDSKGEQTFKITMINATFSMGIDLDIIEEEEADNAWDSFKKCNDAGSALITEIRFPLKYDDVNFRFIGLGPFANSIINAGGMYFLQSQEEILVGKARENIKKVLNSLIC